MGLGVGMFYPNSTTVYTYWKLGSGNPFTGGCCGFDSVTTNSDGVVIGRVLTKPDGAVEISEEEWNDLQQEIVVQGEQIVLDGEAWLHAQKTQEHSLLLSARNKLTQGVPLDPNEATILTGGL